mmetsp:Transcript_24856/g.23879  ORF Transcript_24856/g.23879 Transcript_24856/m.23879 type:complete len:82 (+) Transcript_24856:103-348(+)
MATKVSSNIASEDAITHTIKKGMIEHVPLHVGVGILLGGLSSIVLARGGARKAITAFGGGVGLGSAWTKTSMELEDLLRSA